MSMDPGTMQKLLAARLQGGAGAGGGQAPQMQGSVSPMNAASQLAQKALLVRSLNGGASPQQMWQTHQANAMLPQTQAMMQQDPTMQALQQPQQPLAQNFPVLGDQ